MFASDGAFIGKLAAVEPSEIRSDWALEEIGTVGSGTCDAILTAVLVVEAVLRELKTSATGTADDEQACGHTDCADEEQEFTSELVDCVDCRESTEEIHGGLDHLENDGIDTCRLEDGRSKVHKGVDTSELLSKLDDATDTENLEDERIAEDFSEACLSEFLFGVGVFLI